MSIPAEYRIELVSVPHIDDIWPRISWGLDDACRRNGSGLTADYLWSQCRGGNAYLVLVIGKGEVASASVWRFEQWNTGRKFKCLVLYGKKMREWFDQYKAAVQELARAGGATSMVVEGRLGWKKIFPPETRVLKSVYELEF